MVGHAGAGAGTTVGDGVGGVTESVKSPLLGGVQVEMRDTLSRIEGLIKTGVGKM